MFYVSLSSSLKLIFIEFGPLGGRSILFVTPPDSTPLLGWMMTIIIQATSKEERNCLFSIRWHKTFECNDKPLSYKPLPRKSSVVYVQLPDGPFLWLNNSYHHSRRTSTVYCPSPDGTYGLNGCCSSLFQWPQRCNRHNQNMGRHKVVCLYGRVFCRDKTPLYQRGPQMSMPLHQIALLFCWNDSHHHLSHFQGGPQ